jgi:hypothetical protein
VTLEHRRNRLGLRTEPDDAGTGEACPYSILEHEPEDVVGDQPATRCTGHGRERRLAPAGGPDESDRSATGRHGARVQDTLPLKREDRRQDVAGEQQLGQGALVV